MNEKVCDPSGKLIINFLKKAGHSVVYSEIISDDIELIQKSLKRIQKKQYIDVVITCGGTGISSTDVTIEAVEPFLEKILPGFGELFRIISYNKIGSPAIMTRAIAGIMDNKIIFCLPGSPQAVETAVIELIIPEIGHIIKHVLEIG
jgi:molybdenum cofactor biosynthesis protein B